MRNKLGIMLLLTIAVIFSACTTRLGDFTVLSTKNVEWSKANTYVRSDRAEGDDIAHIILIIPTGVPNLKTAVDAAIETIPGGVALLDAVIEYYRYYFILYGQSGYTVKGNVLVDPAIAALHGFDPYGYMVTTFDEDNNPTTEVVSKEEFLAIQAELVD